MISQLLIASEQIKTQSHTHTHQIPPHLVVSGGGLIFVQAPRVPMYRHRARSPTGAVDKLAGQAELFACYHTDAVLVCACVRECMCVCACLCLSVLVLV
jgi:hypothetical protein